MEQFFVILLILAFTGADLLLRWFKKRSSGGTSGGPRPMERDDADTSGDVPDWLEDLRRHQQEQWRREEAEAAPPTPMEGPRPRLTPTPAQAALAAKMDQRPPASVRYPGKGGAAQIRAWLRSPQDVRKGIVLMNVLGPPKGG